MDRALQDLIGHVRRSSPYHRRLYDGLPDDVGLQGLPLVNHADFWQSSNEDRSLVMTGPQVDGVIMKTGGTTSRPKTTAYSQVELQRTAKLLAAGLIAGGVLPGERIANMFYAGDLYGSFLLHVLSVLELPFPAVHVPIGGLTAIDTAAHLIDQCKVTALLSTATSLVKLSAWFDSLGRTADHVRCVMFGGELLFPAQEHAIRKAFPNASVRSCIYGTVDAGVLAHATTSPDTRVHKAFTESVILEIVRNDGSGEAIERNDEPGLLVATNLNRWLSPVIRYPTGDLAAWVDKESATFRLCGRAAQSVRLGPVSIDVADLRSIVAKALPEGTPIHGVQAVIRRTDSGLDQMECVVAAKIEHTQAAVAAIATELDLQRPMFTQHVALGLIAPLLTSFVDADQLQVTKGSYKLLEVVEKRF